MAGELLFACKAMAVAETPKLVEVGMFWPFFGPLGSLAICFKEIRSYPLVN